MTAAFTFVGDSHISFADGPGNIYSARWTPAFTSYHATQSDTLFEPREQPNVYPRSPNLISRSSRPVAETQQEHALTLNIIDLSGIETTSGLALLICIGYKLLLRRCVLW